MQKRKQKNPMQQFIGSTAKALDKARNEGFQFCADLVMIAIYNTNLNGLTKGGQIRAVKNEVRRLLIEEFGRDMELAAERLEPALEKIREEMKDDAERGRN